MKEYTWDMLNALAEEYCSAKAHGETAEQQRKANQLYEGTFPLLKADQIEHFGSFFINDFGSFDSKKGSWDSFVISRISFRAADDYDEDFGSRRKTIIECNEGENETGKKRKITVKEFPDSLNRSCDESGSELGDTLEGHNGDLFAEAIDLDHSLQVLLSVILALPEHLSGKANNPVRRNYFRLFFTDGVACALRKETDQTTAAEIYGQHEKRLFDAMKLPFLDFFLTTKCRTVFDLLESRLKLYGELVVGRPMEEIEHTLAWYLEAEEKANPGADPNSATVVEAAQRRYNTSKYRPLPNDVYCSYLMLENNNTKRISPNEVSPQRTAYETFISKYLLKNR